MSGQMEWISNVVGEFVTKCVNYSSYDHIYYYSSGMLRNVFYTQNMGQLFSCGMWTWYLANDMQYYVIFLGLLFIHSK